MRKPCTAPYLMTLATRFVFNSTQAEEVLQEAFVQIWYNAKTYDPQKGTAMAWLATIVRYRALDMRRRETSLTTRQDAFVRDQNTVGPSSSGPPERQSRVANFA